MGVGARGVEWDKGKALHLLRFALVARSLVGELARCHPREHQQGVDATAPAELDIGVEPIANHDGARFGLGLPLA